MDKYIIDELDPRFNKLKDLIQKYKWKDLVHGKDRSISYFIPPELVIKEYKTQSIHVTDSLTNWEWCNWVNRQSINKVLEYSCGFDTQVYFDLFRLNIIEIKDRPRCTYCGKYLNWTWRLGRGYNSSTPWVTEDNHFCNHSCQNKYKFKHPELYESVGYTITSWIYGREYDRHDPNEICYFYICRSNGYIKYGMTDNPNNRKYYLGTDNMHIIFTAKFEEVNNLEASVKLHFNGSEYISESELHRLILILKDKLKIRPIPYPF